MLSRVLVRLGVGAIVLDDADPYVELDGQRVLFSISGVAFCSRVRFVILSVTGNAFLVRDGAHLLCCCYLALAAGPSCAGL